MNKVCVRASFNLESHCWLPGPEFRQPDSPTLSLISLDRIVLAVCGCVWLLHAHKMHHLCFWGLAGEASASGASETGRKSHSPASCVCGVGQGMEENFLGGRGSRRPVSREAGQEWLPWGVRTEEAGNGASVHVVPVSNTEIQTFLV